MEILTSWDSLELVMLGSSGGLNNGALFPTFTTCTSAWQLTEGFSKNLVPSSSKERTFISTSCIFVNINYMYISISVVVYIWF